MRDIRLENKQRSTRLVIVDRNTRPTGAPLTATNPNIGSLEGTRGERCPELARLFLLVCGPIGTAVVNVLNSLKTISKDSLVDRLPERGSEAAVEELLALKVLRQESVDRITLDRPRLAEICQALADDIFPSEKLLG